MVTFHHTASRPLTGLEGVLASSWDYHIRRLGWSTGGYAVLVAQDGHIYVAASPFADMTYNAGPRWNPITVAVCAVGCFHKGVEGVPVSKPTPDMLQSLYSVGLSLDDASGAPAGMPWRPHRAIRSTVCPGENLVNHIWLMTSTEYGAADPRPETYR